MEDQKRKAMQFLKKYRIATVRDLRNIGIKSPSSVISQLRKTYNIELNYFPCENSNLTYVVYRYNENKPLR